MGMLSGKIAVITGGSSGIGLATTKRFVSEGAYVFISGRRQDELDKAVAILGCGDGSSERHISNLDDLDRLFATVQAEKGHVDVLFANAGIGNMSPLGAITEEQFDKVFDVNAQGTLQKALSLMRLAAPSYSRDRLQVPWERPPSACTARQRPLSGILLEAGHWT
jgi:NAD(P)-dependent dehydrogenase (short-subunit alcohol dehydrogenase family)